MSLSHVSAWSTTAQEDTKGDPLRKEAYALLKKAGDEGRLNFVGNVEGSMVPLGACDVAVCDGFTGNVQLKTIEGVAKFMSKEIKGVFMASVGTKLGYLLCKKGMDDFREVFDQDKIGGAPFLGIAKPVIKAHGSSNEIAVMNAVRQAIAYTKSGMIDAVKENIQYMTVSSDPQEEGTKMLKIDYKFKDESLLQLAMTHSSYANEHHGTHLQCNERLEFLGDSVLGFVTAGYLFTHYPDLPEGDLTKLRAAVVCEGALDEIAHEIGIPEAIRLGHGEEMGGGRKRASILADATEALLGAIFMDGGIEPARAFVLRFIPHKVEVALAGGAFKDYKTMLQEIVQKNKQETLEYRLAGQSGPDHDKRFTMELLLNSNVFAQGIGKSKKEAEQMAAKKALENMGC